MKSTYNSAKEETRVQKKRKKEKKTAVSGKKITASFFLRGVNSWKKGVKEKKKVRQQNRCGSDANLCYNDCSMMCVVISHVIFVTTKFILNCSA